MQSCDICGIRSLSQKGMCGFIPFINENIFPKSYIINIVKIERAIPQKKTKIIYIVKYPNKINFHRI